MNPLLQDLLEHLELEPLEVNLFRGTSKDIGSPQVFGGQLVAGTIVKTDLQHTRHAVQVQFGRSGGHHTAFLEIRLWRPVTPRIGARF